MSVLQTTSTLGNILKMLLGAQWILAGKKITNYVSLLDLLFLIDTTEIK